MLSAVSHTVVRRPSGATAGLITVEFNYELSYITTESLISIHPLAPLTRWYHAVCAQSAYRVHTAIVLSENERSRFTLDLYLASANVGNVITRYYYGPISCNLIGYRVLCSISQTVIL